MKKFLTSFIAILLFLIPTVFLDASIAYVNGDKFSSSTCSTTCSFTAITATTGNIIVVMVRTGAQDASSITDTAGNTYVKAASRADSTEISSLWYALNITGNASNVVTINFPSGTAFVWASEAQYSGVATAAAIDANVNKLTTGATTIVSPSFSTTQSDELIISTTNMQNGTVTGWTPPAGYTIRQQQALPVTPLADKITSATESGSTVTWTASSGSSDDLQVYVVSFKGASTASPNTATMQVQGQINVTGQLKI